MEQKQCEKCGDMASEAKAFCPGCGHAFVEEEKRQQASEFEKKGNTVQFGQTMYNQMLSDMGLNISKTPDPAPKRIEVIVPAAVPAPSKAAVKSANAQAGKTEPSSNRKWLIYGGIVLLLVVLATIAIIVTGLVVFYWDQIRQLFR